MEKPVKWLRKPLRNTTPIENFLGAVTPTPENPNPWAEYLDLSRPAYEAAHKEGNLVRWVQSRLGAQTRTFVGEFRYYLWEFPTYTLWVANGKGLSVEVIPTQTPDEAMAAYREAMRRLAP